uniref:Phospholipase A(2) n=1 Tax=Acrobeloides nanus TaxID=290746 RepID=A0A914E7E8_9BILA
MVRTYPVMDRYECGSGDFQNLIALNVNCLFCGPIGVAYYNECCKMHDDCYNRQLGKLNCDIQFCCCLTSISMRLQSTYLLCPLNAQTFCNLLNTPAAWDAYTRAGQSSTTK